MRHRQENKINVNTNTHTDTQSFKVSQITEKTLLPAKPHHTEMADFETNPIEETKNPV